MIIAGIIIAVCLILGNDPLDFCDRCWDYAKTKYKNNPLAEITDDDHPPYSDTDYKCELCHKPLTDN